MILGSVVVVAANALAAWARQASDVPNDPDIGAGILLLAGLGIVLGGLLRLRGSARS